MNGGMMTATEVAALLGMNEKTVRRAVITGGLPAVKRGRGWAIDPEDAEAYFDRGQYILNAEDLRNLKARYDELEKRFEQLLALLTVPGGGRRDAATLNEPGGQERRPSSSAVDASASNPGSLSGVVSPGEADSE